MRISGKYKYTYIGIAFASDSDMKFVSAYQKGK